MKTGRVRKKAQPVAEAETTQVPVQPAAKPPGLISTPSQAPSGLAMRPTTGKPGIPIIGILVGLFVCFILVMILLTIFRGGADEWVEATRANGAWTATLTVFGPQVITQERWESDCIADPNGTVRAGTCVMREATTNQEKVVDDYEKYAYNIYYEETWGKTYQAQDTQFVVTALGSDDWWEGNLHYIREEELNKESCEYTNYTVWVDDPQDNTQETEVYLADCEVWDHVVVKERIYAQKPWCQCDVTTVVEIGKYSEQGTGTTVRWPNLRVPEGGHTEQLFNGQVTFRGDDYAYTTTTDDPSQYQEYLTSQYYIGLKDGKPVTVSKNPKK